MLKMSKIDQIHIRAVMLCMSKMSKILTAPDRCFYLNQASLTVFIAGLKRGKTNRSQTATNVAMVIK